ncbi:glycosyltransferase sugar-binding region containing DXD motif [Psychromonas ingrahamii 37]|uniref:Glycosyltransferase sugar-binding region containing DXD motif n=1 Tax=Psychromonas ingrahamii (strain DSM 17664 / CCUG 51855 / 37) TaxID=357804 RepID=A1SRS7_PSYIN|nr:glycosyltransferase [Psychromonas ingrahamii]ABM02192.1 glycosyltransferase sugar-binding region containing DXD motif [Psychromonas ingrahamii 37]
MNAFIFLSNRLSKIIGNICKIMSYPFHAVFPKKRFTIPEFSKAKISSTASKIPRVIWQTNYSNRSTLPVYLNYLFNRLMSLNYDYRYVSTEERIEYIKNNASAAVYKSYMILNDGAAQADLWRLVVLNKEGGVYLDIDANFVWPLSKILKDDDQAVYIKIKNNTHFTNYFLACAPNNNELQQAITIICHKIQEKEVDRGVYFLTGPGVLNTVLAGKKVTSRTHRATCIQGSFTNEHFQYLDKPRGKWTHKKPSELLIKEMDQKNENRNR